MRSAFIFMLVVVMFTSIRFIIISIQLIFIVIRFIFIPIRLTYIETRNLIIKGLKNIAVIERNKGICQQLGFRLRPQAER